MKSRGITQATLAGLTGLSQSQLSQYLTGRATPGVDNLAAIAKALGVSADGLLGLEIIPQPPAPRDPTKEEIAEFILRSLKVSS